MLRKKTLIKRIQNRLNLKSFAKAEEIYNAVIEEQKIGLEKEGAIKLEGIGIIKRVEKAGRTVKVPTKDEKIIVEKRIGLSFKEDTSYKSK